jgi:beta-N-acetylhexosaminidase
MATVLVGCVALLTSVVLVLVGEHHARVARSPTQAAPSPGHDSHSATATPHRDRTVTDAPTRTVTEQPPAMPVAKLARQVIMSGMNGTWPDAQLLHDVRAGRVGGVIIMPSNVSTALPDAVSELQAAAKQGNNPPLLISTDQEGGGVKRLIGPPNIPTQQITTAATAREQGQLTGQLLRHDHINVDLAPVADPPLVPNSFETREQRGFIGSPTQVALLAGGFALGLMDTGVRATAKHFPGNGVFTQDTDNVLVQGQFTRSDALAPFAQLVADDVPLVMISGGIYPHIDTQVALFSPKIMQYMLRDQLHFKGVAITDDLEATALGGTNGSGQRAARALQAGADIALLTSQSGGRSSYDAILAAVRQRALSLSRLRSAASRVLAIKRSLSYG